MNFLIQIFVYLFLINISLTSEVLRPRGVSLIKSSLYDPSREFRCLDGSATLPFRYINDDYCDCRDGSDEPGTAACPNGSFYCANIGHEALELRSSRVNDGICDCCDASDEWASDSACSDVCLELGRAAREEAIRREEETKKGYTLKLGMIEQGRNIKMEKQNKIAQIKLELESAEAIKADRESLKEAAEAPESQALEKYRDAEDAKKVAEKAVASAKNEAEAKEVFDSLDGDSDGRLTKEEIQADDTYDTNRDGTVSEEEAGFYLQLSDSVDFDHFYKQSWRLMRPAYIYEQKKKMGGATAQTPPTSMFTPPSTPPPPPPPPPAQQESNADAASEHSSPPLDDDLASPETDESAEDYDPELDDEQTEEDDEDDLDEDEDTADDDGSQHQSLEVVYDEHTQTLVDAANVARSSFQEAADRVKELNRELTEGQESLEKDYGPEDEFRVFEGNCYEYTDREYNYKLCPFDKASQSAKSGGGETSLGKWGEWQDNYRSMKYSNGQGCWNGPNRSTTVRLECGIENLLVSATEPNKCEYHFVFMTPAVCEGNEPPTLQQQGQQEEVEGQEERVADAHTEL